MPSRRAVLAALAGSVGGLARLRRAIAAVRQEAAVPTAPIRCLAGDGAGLVWANGGPPGSDIIWVRPVNATTGEPPTLARNPSLHVWAEGDPVLCEWMQTGPGANMLTVIYREPPIADLYATFNYSTSSSSYASANQAQYIYHVKGGTLTDIGRPPHTGIYPLSGYAMQSIPQWDQRMSSAVVVDGELIKIAGRFTYPVNQAPPTLSFPSFEGATGEIGLRTICRYSPANGWSEQYIPYDSPTTTEMDSSRTTNLVVDASGNIYFLWWWTPGTVFNTSRVRLWKYALATNLLITPWLYASYFGQSVQGAGDFTFLADFQQSFVPQLLPDRPQLVSGFTVGTSTSFTLWTSNANYFATLYDTQSPATLAPVLGQENTPEMPSSLHFRDDAPADYDPPEAGWRVGDICYAARRSRLMRATGNARGYNDWETLYTYPGVVLAHELSDGRTYLFKELVGETTFGWLGNGSPYSSSGSSTDPRNAITGITSNIGPGNPDAAPTYHGPNLLTTAETVYTLWKIDATGRTPVWTIVRPSGVNGGPVWMCQHRERLYVTVGTGTTTFYTNPHIEAGIYEVNPTTLAVRQIVGVPTDLPHGTQYAGWHSVVGDTPAGNLYF